ncbi:class I SAM-dependent RNA methyltransferase [Agromyces sp. MMS24-JH15]|uniref:class I SAM-dependent RNA methyltransferase n=1 Tax=Agromyces sp. MMS24-JH15 TaxID=3243765 RepID=UPI00374A21D7
MASHDRRTRRRPSAAGGRRPSTPARRDVPTDGPVLELDVERIAHGGVAVAHHEGRVVFVADAIPGERVRARVVDASRDRFWRGDALEVIEASPDRREHVWPEASIDRAPESRPGGAEFGHIRMPRQRDLKGEVLADALARMAHEERAVVVEAVDPALAPDVDPEQGTGWRTRVRLHVDDTGRAGPYAARSHRVVPVASLPLAAPGIVALDPLDRRWNGVDHVDLVVPSVGPAAAVERRAGARDAESPEIVEVVGAREFRLARDGFWQVHRGAAATLTRAIQELVDPERFDPGAANLDLYGGVGLLAAALGDRFGSDVRITSVEADERATGYARANLGDWGRARAVTARVDRFLAAGETSERWTESGRGATVILDPPRSGAGRDVVGHLASLAPAQILYVACDPVALARDLGTFRELGYGLEDLRAYDLFPDTHHVEAVARLGARV